MFHNPEDELSGRLVAGEVPPILKHFAQLHMQTLNGIGGGIDFGISGG